MPDSTSKLFAFLSELNPAGSSGWRRFVVRLVRGMRGESGEW